ncbi:hypothetical protein CDD81_2318 [Ophiocordyceps australis]|uniref:Uncharacterized protein n=1 Tax=Ophiocordyceps australis TaxID=1399860 RepID=A0A2C5XK86_9HYPO|nr:hypothetical protein CDD81_2318 [Ophiocordyceps australis]
MSSAAASVSQPMASPKAAQDGSAVVVTAAPATTATSNKNMGPQALAAMAEQSCKRLVFLEKVPSPKQTATALGACLKASQALNAQINKAEARGKASASKLAALCIERTGFKLGVNDELRDAVNRVSLCAYSTLTHKNVDLTADCLMTYVKIQSLLGRPETLASIFELYATKPKPVVDKGLVSYVRPRANTIAKAIEPDVADMALQTAIDNRNLDAALGIIEASYSLPAFKRHKLIKYATPPAMTLAAMPFGILGLATGYAAYWQNTMDISTATTIGCIGISGYFCSVGSLGLIAKLSNKDQMKRVTWMPGTPLRYRWLREEERAALDKVACAWGFKETWKHGEETGHEWEGLREYMGYRQMLLDRVEFMDGMS